MKKLLLLLSVILLNSQLAFTQSAGIKRVKIPLGDVTVQYKDDAKIVTYERDDVSVGAIFRGDIRRYGKYYEVQIQIRNNSGRDFDFNPQDILATVKTKKGVRQTKAITRSQYMKKVNRKQSWDLALYAYAVTPRNAGKTVVETETVGEVRTRGSVYNGTASTTQQIKGTTTSVIIDEGARQAAYDNASAKYQNYMDNLYEESNSLENEYLKRNTIFNDESINGYICFPYIKGQEFTITIPAGGYEFEFPFFKL